MTRVACPFCGHITPDTRPAIALHLTVSHSGAQPLVEI